MSKEKGRNTRCFWHQTYSFFIIIYYICNNTPSSRLEFPILETPQIVYRVTVVTMLGLFICVLISPRGKVYSPVCWGIWGNCTAGSGNCGWIWLSLQKVVKLSHYIWQWLFFVAKRAFNFTKENEERKKSLFLWACNDRTRGYGFKLKKDRFRLDI